MFAVCSNLTFTSVKLLYEAIKLLATGLVCEYCTAGNIKVISVPLIVPLIGSPFAGGTCVEAVKPVWFIA